MQRDHDSFPLKLFIFYFVFYAGQGVYSGYLNLYLREIGMTQAQIGLVTAIPVVFLVFTQLMWGVLSDKASSKNLILMILYAACTLSLFLFYTSVSYVLVIVFVTIFTIFYSPIQSLQDSMTLEMQQDSRWDFGKMRMGGTIGYALSVLIFGAVLNGIYAKTGSYKDIFWMMSIFLAVGFILLCTLPKVRGHRSPRQKVSYKAIFANKALVCLICFNLMFSLGTNIFYSYYPIYFTEQLGGTSADWGWLLFACSVSEIPVLFLINKVVKKIGFSKVMILGGFITSLRWLLLYLLRSIIPVFAANLLHGLGFISFHFCIVLFINDNVPVELRATAQMLNALIGMLATKILFGYVGGKLCDLFGVNNVMLASSVMMFVSTIIFILWYRKVSSDRTGAAPPEASQNAS